MIRNTKYGAYSQRNVGENGGNMRIRIEKGNMVTMKTATRGVETIENNEFFYNDWEGWKEENGTLHIEASREYRDGVHTIRALITSAGKLIVTTKVKGHYPTLIYREYLLNDGETIEDLSGELILGSGNIDERFVKFRNEWYLEFLKRHNLTAVVHKDPNTQRFFLAKPYHSSNDTEALLTDGYEVFFDYDTPEHKLEKATYAVWCEYTQYVSSRRVLYTEEPLEKLDHILGTVVRKGHVFCLEEETT